MAVSTCDIGHAVPGPGPVKDLPRCVAPKTNFGFLLRCEFPPLEADDFGGILILHVFACGSVACLTATLNAERLGLEALHPSVNRSRKILDKLFMAIDTGIGTQVGCSFGRPGRGRSDGFFPSGLDIRSITGHQEECKACQHNEKQTNFFSLHTLLLSKDSIGSPLL